MDKFPWILIVDDDHNMARSIAAVLHTIGGYQNVKILNDPHEALNQIGSSKYDLVLLDVTMPGLTGFELLDSLDLIAMDTSFIIMTGDISTESAVQALRLGASDYIRKPFDPDELIARIAKALEQHDLRDQHRQVALENQTLEIQLRQSQKMEAIGSLAGGVAHDFNNILSIIMGNAELAKEAIEHDHDAQDKLSKVEIASTRAKELINQLLTFSRKSDSRWEQLDLNSLVTECLLLIRSSAPSNIVIRHDTSDAPHFILSDAIQIHQIALNLCTKAIQAMAQDGGLLILKLESVSNPNLEQSELAPGQYLKLNVVDNGSGIPADISNRIFEPYFTTKEVGRGTGMGLAVVHGIVKAHGGEIRVESVPNVKTAFSVYLPLTDKTVTPSDEIITEFAPPGNESILLVDDEGMILDVISKTLIKLGYRVDTYINSRSALVAFRNAPEEYDLVVTDMRMPGMTGYNLSEEISRIRSNIPIILCSGYNEKFDRETLLGVGNRKFLMKPVSRTELAKNIRELLDESLKERRRDKGFKATNGAFVNFQSNPNELGTLLDVSKSGLSVSYEAHGQFFNEVDKLSIISDDIRVDQIPCRSISKVDNFASEGLKVSRYGIHFEYLTPSQTRQLNRLIENYGKEITHEAQPRPLNQCSLHDREALLSSKKSLLIQL
jgi:DNA-binding NtrC family response regulator